MSSKKTILHIIDYLGRGGAEVMLVKVIKELTEYNNIVVTLNPQNHFGSEFSSDEYICLNMGSIAKFPLAVFKLKKIIKQRNIHIVHSHLFSSTLVARLATPQNIPLITTIHTNVSASNDYKKWYLSILENISYKKHKSTIIGVSTGVLDAYFEHLKHKVYKKYLLYTFVDINDLHFAKSEVKKDATQFKLITIGAIRYPKNHHYLIKAFELLKNENIVLDVYGIGAMLPEITAAVEQTAVNINLKGEVKNASSLIPNYDVYIMSSEFEGFSLSVLETMAIGTTPMLLSDIPSFREQCQDTALYFNLKNPTDFITQLKKLQTDKALCTKLIDAAKQRVNSNFTLQHHMQQLRNIYTETIKNTSEQ